MQNFDHLLESWCFNAQMTLQQIRLVPSVIQVGIVEAVFDGIAHLSGLPDARLNELLQFENNDVGFVLTLEQKGLSCVLLDSSTRLTAGMKAYRTGQVLHVPVGRALLGRIVDPLGRPLDNAGKIHADCYAAIEQSAPDIVVRDHVHEPVQTGIVVVDSLFPLGRGQRELIIGDRCKGKTALAVDVLINQRDSDMICIYIALGQKSSAVARVIQAIQKYGAPERTIFVIATASASPGLQWLAPFAGFTMAEYFRDRGGHSLVVIDDLSKHAATHRELALLTQQPPGREAYPGDIFYLHARLLERAAKLSPQYGGGSLTVLPIAETEAGNLSAYIPTNLISITDGQIVLDTPLFYSGHMPAVDTRLSISRVGGKTQAPVLRTIVESLRLDYAQFLELEMFTRFGTTLDANIQQTILRGQRTRAIFAQEQFSVLSLTAQIVLLLMLQRGIFDKVNAQQINAFKKILPDWLKNIGQPFADAIDQGILPKPEIIEHFLQLLAALLQPASLHKTATACP
jgi:F-type H+-transporting ATPase subunit alpha